MVAAIASNVAAAYANAAGSGLMGATNVSDTENSGPSFASTLESVGQQTMQALQKGEQATSASINGTMPMTDVVSAVNTAQTTLQTMVALRDHVISAYHDILSMPM